MRLLERSPGPSHASGGAGEGQLPSRRRHFFDRARRRNSSPHGRRVNRRTALLAVSAGLAVVVLAGVAMWAWSMLRPRTADELFAGITMTAAVNESSLSATQAIADFGVEEGVRMVPVRIVEDMVLELQLSADRDVTFAAAPRLCLTGPFWNPLDAGLSDRCWGDPDVNDALRAAMPAAAAGTVTLRAGSPVVVRVPIARGDARCDYPPGDWLLEVDAEPVIDGQAQPRQDIAKAPIMIPWDVDGALPWHDNSDTRFCSFTAAVYSRQGEPQIDR